jgi:methionyl-tRNA formyltransferase
MRAVLIGAVESTRVAARCLTSAEGWQLAAIVTLPASLASRHSDFVDLSTDVAPDCRLIQVATANSDAVLDVIAELAPDYLFVIGWSQLCGEHLMAITPGRVVGYHPAPLPRLRGRGVIPWTILLEEPITAGTLFLIDAGTDSGPILAQQFFHVAPDETAASLYARHMTALAGMMPGVLSSLCAGTARPQVQDSRYATWAARRRPEDGELDWTGSARTAWRMVRACGDPYPGARTSYRDDTLVITQAQSVLLGHHLAAIPGQVVERDAHSFTVRCEAGTGLRITEWHWDRAGPPPIHAHLGAAPIVSRP